VRLSYKDLAEMNTETEQTHRKTTTRPLLRSRKQRQSDPSGSRHTLQPLPKRRTPSPSKISNRLPTISPGRKQKSSKVTFKSVPDTQSFSAPSGTPIADSLIASLLDQSANLRASMKEHLELTQLELDKKELEEELEDKENNPEGVNEQILSDSPLLAPLHQPTGWNLPVARLKQLAQLKSLTTTVVSLNIQPFLLSRLKQPTRARPSFVPASNGKKDQGNTARHTNISLFIKFSLPGKTENNFCSRKLVGDVAEFGESALEQIRCDTNLLDIWWGNSMTFTVFCRQVGQKDSIQLGSASIGLKHLLTGDSSLGDGRTISLPVYASQGLFRVVQVPKEERKEVVGTVNVSFQLGSAGPRTGGRSRPVSPQNPVRENGVGSRSQDMQTVCEERVPRKPEFDNVTFSNQAHTAVVGKAMLQNQPTTTPDITNPVLAMLKVEPCQGMSSYSTLFLRWWDGREVKGRTLACVEQVLVPGINGRMFNRKSVSRMLESCLVIEVWLHDNLIGIARVSTDKLARGLKEWKGAVVEAVGGKVEVVDLTEGNIMGLLSVVLSAGTRKQLELLVGREVMSDMMRGVVVEDNIVACKGLDKKTMTVEDRETMTEWNDDEQCNKHDGGKDITEIPTNGYDSPDTDTDSVSEITEDTYDLTAVHSGPSLTEHPTVVEPVISERENFVVQILVEEGRVMANYSWLYCTLPSGLASKASKSSTPTWNLSSQVPLSVDYLKDSQTQLIIRVWSSQTECPDKEKDQMVGFAAIDLSPLLSIPVVSGWYNIINWMGKCRGQVKVTIQPLEEIPRQGSHNLPQYKQSDFVQPGVATPMDGKSTAEIDTQSYIARGMYSSFPSHLVNHTEQIVTKTRPEVEDDVIRPQLWNPPTANFLPPNSTRSFLETSLAKNLSELDLLSSRLMSADNRKTTVSQDEINDLTFIVEETETVPDILSLSMVNSTISNQLASLRSLSGPDTDIPRPECQQIPFPPLHLDLEVLNLEDSLQEQVNSDRSRVAPEGGNTEGY